MKYDPYKQLKQLGHDLMFCDIIYQRPTKETGWHDYINIVYRDLDTEEKKVFTIQDPLYEIYTVKPEHRTFKKPRDFLERNTLGEHIIKYKDRFKEMAKIIAEETGDKKYLEFINNAKGYNEQRMLFLYPYILGADVSIEAYYISRWMRELGNDRPKTATSFFLDIEVNSKAVHYEGDIPRHGECPIDAVTLIDSVTKISHTFLLKTPDNPQIDDFLTPEKKAEFKQKAAEMFSEFDDIADYKCYMFESEIELLKQLFILIHNLKRDFGQIWNGCGFDFPYIVERLKVLKCDPKKFICHSDFPTTTLYYFEDTETFDFERKRSFITVSSYTHWIDQLIQYASLRKSQGSMKKFSLDYVAEHEKVGRKIDHSYLGSFSEFSYSDYMLYVLYNINDVLLQYGIDDKTNDMTRYWSSCMNNSTPYKDGLKQTVTLRWMLYDFLKYDYDMILGNNANFMNVDKKKTDDDEEDEDDSFEGAINSDPELNEHVGLELFGMKSKYLYGDSIDFDFSAMYPNIMIVFNIFKTTMIGKLIIENCESKLSYDEDAGKEFVEDMISGDAIHTGHKWFNLPDGDEMTRLINEELGMLNVA